MKFTFVFNIITNGKPPITKIKEDVKSKLLENVEKTISYYQDKSLNKFDLDDVKIIKKKIKNNQLKLIVSSCNENTNWLARNFDYRYEEIEYNGINYKLQFVRYKINK